MPFQGERILEDDAEVGVVVNNQDFGPGVVFLSDFLADPILPVTLNFPGRF